MSVLPLNELLVYLLAVFLSLVMPIAVTMGSFSSILIPGKYSILTDRADLWSVRSFPGYTFVASFCVHNSYPLQVRYRPELLYCLHKFGS